MRASPNHSCCCCVSWDTQPAVSWLACLIALEACLRSSLVYCRPRVDVSPVPSLDGRVFIAGYKHSQKVLIKRCSYCSTNLEMLEVSASWLFHAAMNILWERKHLVSDSFYSTATHRAGNLPDLAKNQNHCPSIHPSTSLSESTSAPPHRGVWFSR